MIGPNQCLSLGGVQAGARYHANRPDMLSGSCTGSLVQDLEPAKFGTRVLACAIADTAQRCGSDGVCMAPPEAPFDGRVCIATQGAVQYPSGPYADRFVYHANLADNRS